MKFTDIVKGKGLTGPIQKADRLENLSERRTRDFQILAAPLAGFGQRTGKRLSVRKAVACP